MFSEVLRFEGRQGQTFRIYAALIGVHKYCLEHNNFVRFSRYQPKIINLNRPPLME